MIHRNNNHIKEIVQKKEIQVVAEDQILEKDIHQDQGQILEKEIIATTSTAVVLRKENHLERIKILEIISFKNQQIQTLDLKSHANIMKNMDNVLNLHVLIYTEMKIQEFNKMNLIQIIITSTTTTIIII